MEDLTKHQLILLTLLVSFVTSIATGIITYTLLQEAPVEVTNTINRVVERTIETVTPSEGGKEVVKEVQVINEEDLVLSSIEKNTKSIVRIKTKGADGSDIISGLGLVISNTGDVVFDTRGYNQNAATHVIFADGRTFSVLKVYSDPASGFIFMKLDMTGHPKEEQNFSPAVFGTAASLKLGQSVIAVAGRESNAVNVGRISELKLEADGKTLDRIVSNLKASSNLPGVPLLSVSGEIVGLEVVGPTEVETSATFTPIDGLKSLISKAISELGK